MVQLKQCVVESGSHKALLAFVLTILNYFSLSSNEDDLHARYNQQSLALISKLPDNRTKAYTLLLNCIGSSNLGLAENLSLGQECLRIFSELDDVWGIALAELIMGDICVFTGGELEQGRSYYESSMQLFNNMQDHWGLSLCYVGLTEIAYREKKWDEVSQLGAQAVGYLEQLGNVERMSYLRFLLGEAAIKSGRVEEAKIHFTANMEFYTHQGDERGRYYFQQRLDELLQRQQEEKDV